MKQQYHLSEFTDIKKAESWLNEEYQNGYRLLVGPMQGAGQFFFFVTERIPLDISKRRAVREPAAKPKKSRTPTCKKSDDEKDVS